MICVKPYFIKHITKDLSSKQWHRIGDEVGSKRSSTPVFLNLFKSKAPLSLSEKNLSGCFEQCHHNSSLAHSKSGLTLNTFIFFPNLHLYILLLVFVWITFFLPLLMTSHGPLIEIHKFSPSYCLLCDQPYLTGSCFHISPVAEISTISPAKLS